MPIIVNYYILCALVNLSLCVSVCDAFFARQFFLAIYPSSIADLCVPKTHASLMLLLCISSIYAVCCRFYVYLLLFHFKKLFETEKKAKQPYFKSKLLRVTCIFICLLFIDRRVYMSSLVLKHIHTNMIK